MELITLGLFCALLLLCLLLDWSILIALAIGLLLFLAYGRRKNFTWPELMGMVFSGIRTVKNVLLTFVLIGILTALWRASGTIAVIVCYAAELIRPSVFLLMTFLLNCMVSVLTGTAFGTAATMGVICTTMAASMQVPPALAGGAVLSGIYFGDRCSPVSTSAQLVAEVTDTSIFRNICSMLRAALVPFAAACAVYLLAGLTMGITAAAPDLRAVFEREFEISWIALLPVAALLILSVLKVKARVSMTVSALAAVPVYLYVQHMPLMALPQLFLLGYQAANAEAALINGGGIVSMIKVAAIVCLSSSYSGIFQRTGILDGLKHGIAVLAERTTPYIAILCTSVVTGLVACNQTLTIMLTQQLCDEAEPEPEQFALALEDSAVVVAPMIPWSIASEVPLAAAGCPTRSIAFAFFLVLLPLWHAGASLWGKRKSA